jgi:hypothetical protein
MPISNSPLRGVTHLVSFDDLRQYGRRALEQNTEDETLIERYCTAYRQWILSSKLNSVQGLEQFPYACFSNGTTEAFDKFYIKHKGKTVKVLRDEYSYHRKFAGAEYIDSFKSLTSSDVLVISSPFSSTGNVHPLIEEILTVCDYLEIPVLMDCAYYGLCGDSQFNFDHPCIEDVAFSLSKTFGASKYRIGIRFSKTNKDSLAVLNLDSNSYINRFGANLGLELMQAFSPDYLFETYRSTQLEFCNTLKVEPSNCVIFGIDTDQTYGKNWAPDEARRLCFSRYLDSAKLPFMF